MLNSKQGFLNLNIQNGHVMTPQKWYPWLFRSFWYLICKGIKNNNGEIRIYNNPSKMTLKKSKVLMHAECIKLTSDVFEQRVPSRASDVLEGAEFCSGKNPSASRRWPLSSIFRLVLPSPHALWVNHTEQPISWHCDWLLPMLIEHGVASWWFRSLLKDKL